MAGQQHPPKSSSPKSARSGRITDFFQPIKQGGNLKNSKRQLDNEDVRDSPPFKKLRGTSTEDEHAEPITIVRLRVEVATPKPRRKPAHGRLLDDNDSVRLANKNNTPKPKKKPLHARLLDDVDGGLADRLVGRFKTPRYEAGQGNKSSEDGTATGDADDTARRRRSKAPSPRLPTPRPKKKSSSARLLDDTDGGLNGALASRFETTRYEEPIPKDKAKHLNKSPKRDDLSDEPTTAKNNDIDATPRDRLKQGDNGHATSIRTPRYKANVDTPEPKTKKPASTRLLDDTDGGLHESLVGRRDFFKETSAQDTDPVEDAHPKSSRPIHTLARLNNTRRKRPASSRLLDEADRGLLESLVGRSETPRYDEEVAGHQEEKGKDNSMHGAVDDNTLDDDTEAETIKADDSEDNTSSDQDGEDYDSEAASGEGEDSEGDDSEGDDSDKENVAPRNRSRAPSPPSLP
ncbi:hypothetical protein N0V85_003962 [Neurospora sp. IMI 360204]|nr:hypothetical protein N0V85_003962 [Neurospora sp. IMI 360204]